MPNINRPSLKHPTNFRTKDGDQWLPFTDDVQINQMIEAFMVINSKIIWGIGGFFITVIVSFLVYGLAQIDWSTSQSVNTGVLDKITDADYTKVFNNTFVNVFIMLNVVLGLMLFDRYLNDKKKKLMKEA